MCKRTMYKRARIPTFLWERRACANSGAQAVFPRPRKNVLGTRLVPPQIEAGGPRPHMTCARTLAQIMASQRPLGYLQPRKSTRLVTYQVTKWVSFL